MSFHRLVALGATTVLVGLLGIAEASNSSAPKKTEKPSAAVSALREKIRNAKIEGCGG